MGSGGVAIAALPTVICLKVPFSDGLGGGGCLLTPVQGIHLLKSSGVLPSFVCPSLNKTNIKHSFIMVFLGGYGEM